MAEVQSFRSFSPPSLSNTSCTHKIEEASGLVSFPSAVSCRCGSNTQTSLLGWRPIQTAALNVSFDCEILHSLEKKRVSTSLLVSLWTCPLQQMRLEHFELFFCLTFSIWYGSKHIKICVTREWNVARKGQITCVRTLKSSRVALSRLPKEIFVSKHFLIQQPEAESIWRFSSWVKNNLIHEVLFLLRNVYFQNWIIRNNVQKERKEQCSFSRNHFRSSWEITKVDWSVLKTTEGFVFCTRRPQTYVIIDCFQWRF